MSVEPGPFVGLAPFSPATARYFTGRDRFALTLAGVMLQSRVSVLYGASGCGKTSVLNAALPEALAGIMAAPARDDRRDGAAAIATDDKSAAANPGPSHRLLQFRRWHPGLEARRANAAAAYLGTPSEDRSLENASLSLANAVARWQQPRAPILFVLDQFEEFLFYTRDVADSSFLRTIAAFIGNGQLNVRVLIAIREDALSALDRVRAMIPGILTSPVRMDSLGGDDAGNAIRIPVERWSRRSSLATPIEVEDELVGGLLKEIRKDRYKSSGATAAESNTVELPLLQLTMQSVWEEESRDGCPPESLKWQTLDRLGGADGVLRSHLRETIQRLSASRRLLAARMFDHLVSPSGAKHAWRASDLTEQLNAPRVAAAEAAKGVVPTLLRRFFRKEEPEADVDDVFATLLSLASGRVRVLRQQPDPSGTAVLFELYHDSLAIPIRDWVRQTRIEFERKRLRSDLLIFMGFMALIVVVVGFGVFAQVRTIQHDISSQTRLARIRETQVMNAAVRSAAEDGDGTTGMAAALAFLDEPTRRGDVAEPEFIATALLEALHANRERDVRILSGVVPSAVAIAPTGDSVVTADEDGRVTIWDISRADRSPKLLNGHQKQVTSAAFDESGGHLLTTSDDGTVRVWDLTAASPMAVVLDDGNDLIVRAAIAPDGREVATGSHDGVVQIWDITKPKPEARELGQHRAALTQIAFSPSGQRLVTGSKDNTARVWIVASGASFELTDDLNRQVTDASFFADDRLVIAKGKTASVWDAMGGDDGKSGPVAFKRTAAFSGHNGDVTSARFSQDGTRVVTGSKDNEARVWTIPDGKAERIVLHGHEGPLLYAAFLRDGLHVVTVGQDRRAGLWDIGQYPPAVTWIEGHRDPIVAADVSRDATRLVTVSNDKTMRVWDITEGGPNTVILDGDGPVTDLSYSPDGWRIAAVSGGAVRVWQGIGEDRSTDVIANGIGTDAFARFSPVDSDRLIVGTGDRTVLLWNLAGTNRSFVPLVGHSKSVTKAFFAPRDGSLLVTISDDNTGIVWDMRPSPNSASTQPSSIAVLPHSARIDSAAFSQNGSYFITVSDGDARVWTLTGDSPATTVLHIEGSRMYRAFLDNDGQRAVTFSEFSRVDPYGRTLWDRRMDLWDLTRAKLAPTTFSRDSRQVSRASIAPAGKLRLALTLDDGSVQLWNLDRAPISLSNVQGPRGSAGHFAFSNSGDRLVTGTNDGRVWIWDLTGDQPVPAKLTGHRSAISAAAFSPQGDFLVTGSVDGTIRIWIAPPVEKLIRVTRESLVRCLTPTQRLDFELAETPPDSAAAGELPCRFTPQH